MNIPCRSCTPKRRILAAMRRPITTADAMRVAHLKSRQLAAFHLAAMVRAGLIARVDGKWVKR